MTETANQFNDQVQDRIYTFSLNSKIVNRFAWGANVVGGVFLAKSLIKLEAGKDARGFALGLASMACFMAAMELGADAEANARLY